MRIKVGLSNMKVRIVKVKLYLIILEFIRACINKTSLLTDDKLKITFELFDKDGSGGITPDEMKLILGLTSKYSDKVWNEILGSIERNSNDEVTMVEFKSMMLKLALIDLKN
jgi:calcium-dependent protein kinase